MNIELIMTIVLLVIMGLSILTGLIQGFKKNTYGLICTILFWIIFWITAPLVKGNNLWYNEENFKNIASATNMDTLNATCLMDFLKAFISQELNLDPSIALDPAFEHTLIAIVMGIFKIFYFGNNENATMRIVIFFLSLKFS